MGCAPCIDVKGGSCSRAPVAVTSEHYLLSIKRNTVPCVPYPGLLNLPGNTQLFAWQESLSLRPCPYGGPFLPEPFASVTLLCSPCHLFCPHAHVHLTKYAVKEYETNRTGATQMWAPTYSHLPVEFQFQRGAFAVPVFRDMSGSQLVHPHLCSQLMLTTSAK